MRLSLAFGSALALASCLPAGPGAGPAPSPRPAVSQAPPSPPPAPGTKPLPPRSPEDTLPPLAATRHDSLVLARQARDSALDARVLDVLAEAHPPESGTSDDLDAAWRAMFDIDVANWMEHR